MINPGKGLPTPKDKRWALSFIVVSVLTLAFRPGFIPQADQPIARGQPALATNIVSGCPLVLPFPPTTILYLPVIPFPPTVNSNLKLQAPRQGAYHSAFPEFVNEDEEAEPASIEKIETFEALAGKEIVWAYFSNEWTDGIHFPKEDVCTIHRAGKVPFIRMMPYNRDTEFKELHDCEAPPGFEPAYKMQDFIEGKYDVELQEWAREAKAVGIPLLVQFGVEVNGCWFSWNGKWHGGGQTDGYGNSSVADGPERFRDAYRHVINLFRAEGVTNITWFFHINYSSSPSVDWNEFINYYPGDTYIDWIGVSTYGAQEITADWHTFPEVFEGVYDEIVQSPTISSTKPIAILEIAVVENHPNGVKAEWITEALRTIRAGPYPRLKGISWWQERWTNSDSSVSDLRINSSITDTLTAYRQGIAPNFFVTQAIFGPNVPAVRP